MDLYTGSGLLYVGSKTRPSTAITNETYNKWYDEIHVPHILETSGVQSATRYIACSSSSSSTGPDELNWPFLAIYPIEDLKYLTTEEFASIPLVDDLLPGPNHSCVDCADFDQRHYASVGDFQLGEPYNGTTTPKLLIAHFNPPSELHDADSTTMRNWYSQQQTSGVDQRIQLFKLVFGRRFQGDQSRKLPSFIAMHHVATEANYSQVSKSIKAISVAIAGYDLWRAFGLLHPGSEGRTG
ncbi:hypothetical protein BJX68DRAFT_273083 [Aspergillus pseudodeflectus]|uniref:EthD domain-containing protein n=1 Tax=Aspergillus pseudodeflectus TaxID=176178 RepID=A0ABR4JBC9_9EURO